MAHFTALAAARHKLLADKGWSVEEKGLVGSPPIRVLVGEHHETLLRALALSRYRNQRRCPRFDGR